MRATQTPWPRQLRRPKSTEIEIGLGVIVWAGLVFVVVHFAAHLT